MKSLTAYSSEKALDILTPGAIDAISGNLWLPFLYRIENVFDNISHSIPKGEYPIECISDDGEDGEKEKKVHYPSLLSSKGLKGRYIRPEILKEFCRVFPQFVCRCETTRLGSSRAHRFFFYNSKDILPENPEGYYSISTFRELHPSDNNKLIEFFVSREIPITMGISIRRAHDQGTFDEDFNEIY